MKALKTIVATAVIVFALTTVAMAGVQHLTKQSGQASGSQAQTAQPTYTVTLTAAQLAQLMHGSQASTTGGVHHARQTQRHKAARDHTSSHHAVEATHVSTSASGGTHHHEPVHHAYSSGSNAGNCISGTSHHSSGHSDGGGDCGD